MKLAAILGWCLNVLANQRGNVGEQPAEPVAPVEPQPEDAETGEAEEGVTPTPEPEPEVVPKKALLEERRKRQELERMLDQARNPQPPQPAAPAFDPDSFIPPGMAPEPTLDQFEDYDTYSRALARWEARRIIAVERHVEQQNEVMKQRETVFDSHNKRVAAAQAKYQDWDEVLVSAPNVQFSDAAFAAILDSDQSADITYFLAKNPEEAAKIAAMPPHQAVKAIGKLEVKFSSPPPEPKRVTQAPTPITPIGGGGSAHAKSPEQMSDDEWMAHERERLKATGRLY